MDLQDILVVHVSLGTQVLIVKVRSESLFFMPQAHKIYSFAIHGQKCETVTLLFIYSKALFE